jgi:uncharacterized membrane protein
LRRAALACHCVLLATAVVTVAGGRATLAAVFGAALAAAPLLLTLRGLLDARPRALQWLAVVLVPYSGAAVVEVIASGGAERVAAVALLAAVAELGAVLALIRRSSKRVTIGE